MYISITTFSASTKTDIRSTISKLKPFEIFFSENQKRKRIKVEKNGNLDIVKIFWRFCEIFSFLENSMCFEDIELQKMDQKLTIFCHFLEKRTQKRTRTSNPSIIWQKIRKISPKLWKISKVAVQNRIKTCPNKQEAQNRGNSQLSAGLSRNFWLLREFLLCLCIPCCLHVWELVFWRNLDHFLP